MATKTASELEQEYGIWGECPAAPLCDWRMDVNNNDTRLGYWSWVAAMLESHEDSDDGQDRESYSDTQDRESYSA